MARVVGRKISDVTQGILHCRYAGLSDRRDGRPRSVVYASARPKVKDSVCRKQFQHVR